MIKKILNIFTRSQKIGLIGLLTIIFINACFELLCLPVVTPIINLATNQNSISNNKIVIIAKRIFQLESTRSMVLFSLILIVIVYILKNFIIIVLYKIQFNYVYNGQKELSSRILDKYIFEEYHFHKMHNVAELQRDVVNDVMNFYTTVLTILQLITEIVVCFALASYLFVQDIVVTSCTVAILGIMLIIIMVLYKRRLSQLGEDARELSAVTNKWILQSFGSIKEIKVFGKEQYFSKRFRDANGKYNNTLKKQQTLVNIPKPVIEATAISAIMFSLVIRLNISNDLPVIMETLTVFAVAAFRLMPSFNRITSYITTLTYYSASVNAVSDHVKGHDLKKISNNNENVDMEGNIVFNDVSFKYPDGESNVLENVNLVINRNESVAFIGPSGAGKSTLADLLLGIYAPSEGIITIGDTNIINSMNDWHRCIGYIPQSIYLLDDTIRANIAFGIDPEEIDDQKISKAVEQAQLKSFISELNDGLETMVGESGVRLSGGQKQRIGIARALYNNPGVLILDEATSALDNDTECAVMTAINDLQGKKTIIVIAHRLSTIRNCDSIYEVKNRKAVLISNDERRKLLDDI